MTAPQPKSDQTQAPRSGAPPDLSALNGERIAFLDRLSGMSRRDAQRLVRQHGGTVANALDAETTLAIVGDEGPDLDAWLQKDDILDADARSAIRAGQMTVLRESQLWERIGLLAGEHDARRLYTPAMLADLVGVPASTIRRWHRRGVLRVTRQVRRLAFFDFTEVTVARRLSELLAAGCSLRVIERKLDDLARRMPDVARPLADLPLVVEGKQLLVRRGEDLSEPGGQLLLDFDAAEDTFDAADSDHGATPVAISIEDARLRVHGQRGTAETLPTSEELLAAAIDMDNDGDLPAAAEMYRACLVAGPTAEANFLLADVLYRLGDLPAARERYYAAIELDETFVEARVNLGCILAETGEPELAVAAIEGALALQADYPDVHFHLARTLDAVDRRDEAEAHWRAFLNLAPDSPWADQAEARLGNTE